jgi:hypothetical protein
MLAWTLQYKRATKEGEKMPCDYRNYAPDWKSRIRPAILDRSRHTLFESQAPKCERCGRLDRSFGDNGKQIVLTVAHRDQDKKNNLFTEKPWEIDDPSKNNLLALCQKHHFDLDRSENLKKAKETRVAGKIAKESTIKKNDGKARKTAVPSLSENEKKKDVKKTQKKRQRGKARKSADPSLSDDNKTLGFNSTKKRKIRNTSDKDAQRGNARKSAVPSLSENVQESEFVKKAKLSSIDLSAVPSLSEEKAERKRRNKEKKESVEKYRAKEGLDPKKKKKEEALSLPYHQKVYIGKPLICYTSSTFPLDGNGKVLTKKEECRIWEGIVNGSEGERTEKEE